MAWFIACEKTAKAAANHGIFKNKILKGVKLSLNFECYNICEHTQYLLFEMYKAIQLLCI